MTLSRRKLREIELDMDDRKFFLGGKTSHEIVLFREVSPEYDKAVEKLVGALSKIANHKQTSVDKIYLIHQCEGYQTVAREALEAYEKARGK